MTPDALELLLAGPFVCISRRAGRSATAQRAETPRLGALNPVHQDGREPIRNGAPVALVTMAVADAVAVVGDTKATYFTWRPTPAIQEGDSDGNRLTIGDPAWTSRLGCRWRVA